MLSLKAVRTVVFGAVCGLLVAAVQVSGSIGARQASLDATTRCDLCATASAVALEYARLERRIATGLAHAEPDAVPDTRLRYDALSDRVAALEGAELRAFVGERPDAAAILRDLAAAMGQLPSIIARPDGGDAALRLMAPLDFDLSRLAAEVDRWGEARGAAGQAELRRLYTVFTAVLVVLFACGATLLVLLFRHERRLGSARDSLARSGMELASLSSDLASADAALGARDIALDLRDRELRLQNRRFDAALDNMSMALCMVDAEDRLVVYNRRFADLFGLDPAPVPGLPFSDLVARASGPRLAEVLVRQRALGAAPDGGDFVEEVAASPAEAPDLRLSLSVSHRPMGDGGWVATYDDVTHRRQAEARIAHLARHDPLTGLCNRAFFVERLDAALVEALRRNTRVAVHCIDIDGFREVNDGFGHRTGDELLREVARRLAAETGASSVARLGGDEFAVLQTGLGAVGAEPFAERLSRALCRPFPTAKVEIDLSACLGHAASPDDAATPDALLNGALAALASARNAGRGAVRAFVPDMDAARRARRALEVDLRCALAADQFVVFFQPLVDARRVRVTGFEALLRWRHPVRGFVSPVEFIPVAEDIGLIGEIGAWVLGEACRQAAAWPGDQTVAVNLSPAQFDRMDLALAVEDALSRSGLDPRRLELEITESVPLRDDGLDVLHTLRARGIRIAMDDFGTGYSSLSYLRRFPFDKIKIDQSFVRDLASRPDCVKIVRSIAALGASLGMITTAEGVETAEQFRQLQAAGCDQVQGFHFGRPRPAGDIAFDLASGASAPA